MKTALRSILCFFLISSVLSGASTFDAFAVEVTDFNITFDNSNAKVLRQGITQRAVVDSLKNKDGEVETIAYQAYHLEFAFEQKFSNNRQYASIEFYNGNKVIHVMPLTDPSRKLTTTRNRLRESNYMAVNLEGLPLILLDDVTRINFKR
ncbi:MAG: hypothetical protein ACSHYA_16530 [Opitutaceae bacterium]